MAGFIHHNLLYLYLLALMTFYCLLLGLQWRYGIIQRSSCIIQRLSLSKGFLTLLFVSSLLAVSFVAHGLLQRFAQADSEYINIYQAQTFLKGRLFNKPPPSQDFFSIKGIVNKNGKYLARCFPGWPFLLTMASLLNFPLWLLNPLLGSVSLIILFFLAKLLYNHTVALLSVVSVLGSGFFLFNTASFYAHTSCALFILLAVYSVCLFYKKKPLLRYLFLCGLCLGLAYLIRPFSTLCCLVPILTTFIIQRQKGIFPKDIGFILLGLAPFFILNFFYNFFVTGHFWLSPFNWTDPHDTLQLKWSIIRDNINGLAYQLLWVNPVLFVFYFVWIIKLMLTRKIQPLDLVFFLLVMGCFFYAVPGVSYGFRYYYEGYFLCVLTVIGGVLQLNKIFAKYLIILGLMAGFLSHLASVPLLAYHYRNKIHAQKALYRLVQKEHLSNAVVFIPPATPSSLTEARNDPDLANPVLFVHDLKEKNASLLKYFPSRSYYRYLPNEKNDGVLQKLS